MKAALAPLSGPYSQGGTSLGSARGAAQLTQGIGLWEEPQAALWAMGRPLS